MKYFKILCFALLSTGLFACEEELIAPSQSAATEASGEGVNARKGQKFRNGMYNVQFSNDSNLNLNTDADIESLAETIAMAQLTFQGIYNFDGFKGFTCYLSGKQATVFLNDSRVLLIEPDGVVSPL